MHHGLDVGATIPGVAKISRYMFRFFPEAKKLACKGQTIVALIRLLADGKAAVRAAAAGALMRCILKAFHLLVYNSFKLNKTTASASKSKAKRS
jgi:hypothetical protein